MGAHPHGPMARAFAMRRAPGVFDDHRPGPGRIGLEAVQCAVIGIYIGCIYIYIGYIYIGYIYRVYIYRVYIYRVYNINSMYICTYSIYIHMYGFVLK